MSLICPYMWGDMLAMDMKGKMSIALWLAYFPPAILTGEHCRCRSVSLAGLWASQPTRGFRRWFGSLLLVRVVRDVRWTELALRTPRKYLVFPSGSCRCTPSGVRPVRSPSRQVAANTMRPQVGTCFPSLCRANVGV